MCTYIYSEIRHDRANTRPIRYWRAPFVLSEYRSAKSSTAPEDSWHCCRNGLSVSLSEIPGRSGALNTHTHTNPRQCAMAIELKALRLLARNRIDCGRPSRFAKNCVGTSRKLLFLQERDARSVVPRAFVFPSINSIKTACDNIWTASEGNRSITKLNLESAVLC